jgi:hypothetical protein
MLIAHCHAFSFNAASGPNQALSILSTAFVDRIWFFLVATPKVVGQILGA